MPSSTGIAALVALLVAFGSPLFDAGPVGADEPVPEGAPEGEPVPGDEPSADEPAPEEPPDDDLPDDLPPLPAPPSAPPSPSDPPASAAEEPRDVAPPLAEDVVVLTNGSEWRGRICRETEREIEIEAVGRSGSVQRVSLPRARIAEVRRAPRDGAEPVLGAREESEEWFLLHAEGRIVGWRRVSVTRVRSSQFSGWRLEEEILEFAQGRHLPETRTRRLEVIDDEFVPRLIEYREASEAEGSRGYERLVSGEVENGVWRLVATGDGETRRRNVDIPPGARGALAWREWMRRATPRAIGLFDAHLVDPAAEGLTPLQIGFVSAGSTAEWHRVVGGRRLVGRFDAKGEAPYEEIAEGLIARPSTSRRCLAAEAGETIGAEERAEVAADPTRIVHVAEIGLAFDRPTESWSWKADLVDASRTGWRRIGLLTEKRRLIDVRVEWHPEGEGAPVEVADRAAWLVTRLRTRCPDLVELPAGPPPVIPGAQRLDFVGTLHGERLRTIVVWIARPRGLIVLIGAGPERSWAEDSAELERFLQSVRLL